MAVRSLGPDEPVRVLYVGADDEYRNRFRSALQHAEATEGIEALYLTRRSHARLAFESGRVDAVFAEFLLPDGTGPELLQELCHLDPAVHGVLLTSRPGQVTDRVHAVWDKAAPVYELRSYLERIVSIRRLRGVGRD